MWCFLGESSSLTNTLSRSSEGDSRVEWGIPISGERTALTCPTSNSEVIGSCKEGTKYFWFIASLLFLCCDFSQINIVEEKIVVF